MTIFAPVSSKLLQQAFVSLGLIAAMAACNTSSSLRVNNLDSVEVAADDSDYLFVHYTGKVSYQTDPELSTCHLYVYKSKKTGQVKSVKLSGGTRSDEQGYFEVGLSADSKNSKIAPIADFKVQPSKQNSGFSRIAYGEEAEERSFGSSLTITEIAVKGQQKDGFDQVIASETHQVKTLGSIRTNDKGYDPEIVECDHLKQVAEKASDKPAASQEVAKVQGADTKLLYQVQHFSGKVSYRTSEYTTCDLYIYRAKVDGKVLAVNLSGGTRGHEFGYLDVSASDDDKQSKNPPMMDFTEQSSKQNAGFTQIGFRQESEAKSLTWSGITTTEISIKGKQKDGFDKVIGSETHQVKTLGTIVTQDKSYEPEIIECENVKLVDSKDTNRIGSN